MLQPRGVSGKWPPPDTAPGSPGEGEGGCVEVCRPQTKGSSETVGVWGQGGNTRGEGCCALPRKVPAALQDLCAPQPTEGPPCPLSCGGLRGEGATKQATEREWMAGGGQRWGD